MKPKIIVIDDHESVLEGTVSQLQKQYPEAEIVTAKTAQIAQEYVERLSPDLVVADLSIPKQQGDTARTDTGIQLLKTLMKLYPTLNMVVQSANIKALIRLKP
ncbi:MAG: response regulator transcription factor, partial [Moorea sp. SIO3I7]|nr:response regulator transcription factor [Moorena sp. SIO3I7]